MCSLHRQCDENGEILLFHVLRECDELREALVEWLAFHGIDAGKVPNPGCIDRDIEHRAVHVLQWNAGSGYGVGTYQGETEPAPFPDKVLQQTESVQVYVRTAVLTEIHPAVGCLTMRNEKDNG